MTLARSVSFDGRLATANKFQDDLFAALKTLGFQVVANGTEHTHPAFVERLRGSTDQTSLAIRFQPDGVACIGAIPRTLYVEAKNAGNIERTAYEQYMKLYAAGNLVAIVFGKLDWRWNFIERLQLVPGQETVSKFAPGQRFPVVDDWITPRQAQHWNALRFANPQASGTPYREIAPVSLLPWMTFKPEVISRLTSL